MRKYVLNWVHTKMCVGLQPDQKQFIVSSKICVFFSNKQNEFLNVKT